MPQAINTCTKLTPIMVLLNGDKNVSNGRNVKVFSMFGALLIFIMLWNYNSAWNIEFNGKIKIGSWSSILTWLVNCMYYKYSRRISCHQQAPPRHWHPSVTTSCQNPKYNSLILTQAYAHYWVHCVHSSCIRTLLCTLCSQLMHMRITEYAVFTTHAYADYWVHCVHIPWICTLLSTLCSQLKHMRITEYTVFTTHAYAHYCVHCVHSSWIRTLLSTLCSQLMNTHITVYTVFTAHAYAHYWVHCVHSSCICTLLSTLCSQPMHMQITEYTVFTDHAYTHYWVHCVHSPCIRTFPGVIC
jgi:hypothetical protein